MIISTVLEFLSVALLIIGFINEKKFVMLEDKILLLILNKMG